MSELGLGFNKKDSRPCFSVTVLSASVLMYLGLSLAHWLATLSIHILTTSLFEMLFPNGVKMVLF